MNGDQCKFSHAAPSLRSNGSSSGGSGGGIVSSQQRPKSTKPSRLLEVREIPPDLNNMAKLIQHFCKFGDVKTIRCGQTVDDHRDPKAAVVEYATVAEAIKAHGDPGAILGSRFIVLHFAHPSGSNARAHQNGQALNKSFNKPSVKPRLAGNKHAAAFVAARAAKAKAAKEAAASKAAANKRTKEMQKMLALQAQQQAQLEKLYTKQKTMMAKAKDPSLNKEAKTKILKMLLKLNELIKLKMKTVAASMEGACWCACLYFVHMCSYAYVCMWPSRVQVLVWVNHATFCCAAPRNMAVCCLSPSPF